MKPPVPDPLWYKDAIVYQLHVRSFCDGNGDGVGDFRGLTSKLDHLQALGVTAVWLLPFYPSPLRDDGYDIADYKKVHPKYGTLADFKEFLAQAHRRGLKVITELVINHTSDRHPWFQRARCAKKGSKAREFYVWSDDDQKYQEVRIIFRDFEPSNWTWDAKAKQYYWHRFFRHQPDLNFDNPAVHAAVFDVMDFWMRLGVDGMRLDAVPYLYEREHSSCENLPEGHAFLRQLRAHLDRGHAGRMLLGEACQWPEDTVPYFGQGDECHANFHFPVMPRLYMALAQQDRTPILDILAETPPIPETCQWFTFLRNHDELTLEMVTDEERVWMWDHYAKDPRARINLGIRRRLAPLLGGDRRKIELMFALLCSLPGTPVIYYGDEIGMGDDLDLPDRHGLRTPMQWDASPNAGFSRANAKKLVLPVVANDEFHYTKVNVARANAAPDSLLAWVKRLLAARKQSFAFGRGTIRCLEPANRAVLAFVRQHGDDAVLVVCNLSTAAQAAELDLAAHAGVQPVEVFDRTPWPVIGAGPYAVTLAPYSFFWVQLGQAHAASTPSPAPALAELRHARIFCANHRDVREVLRSTLTLPTGARIARFATSYRDGGADTWLVPENAPGLAAEVVGLIGRRVRRDGFCGEPTSALRRKDFTRLPKPAPVGAEQSNLSFVFGERLVLKWICRQESGPNPDFEVPRHLHEHTGFAHCAPVLGALHHGDATVAILHGYVRNVGDAWSVFQRKLAGVWAAGPARSLHGAVERLEDFLPLVARLGRRTAQLHQALAQPARDRAFAPEAFTPFYQRGLLQSLRHLVRKVWAAAPAGLPLPDPERALARFEVLRHKTFAGLRTRVHGDYHLGQVLVTPDEDCVVIDFEGEPLKPLGERRLKRSPLRDVAGMVRSFDYAAAVARRDAAPKLAAERLDAYSAWLNGWRAAVVSAFLASYEAALEGTQIVPLDDLQTLLDVYVLEKAIYELAYELAPRPDWVDIPLAAIQALLRKER